MKTCESIITHQKTVIARLESALGCDDPVKTIDSGCTMCLTSLQTALNASQTRLSDQIHEESCAIGHVFDGVSLLTRQGRNGKGAAEPPCEAADGFGVMPQAYESPIACQTTELQDSFRKQFVKLQNSSEIPSDSRL